MAFLSLFSTLYYCLCCSLLDIALFIFVDVVAKTILKSTPDEAERRTIWLYECLSLTVLCVIVYLFDHFPYTLIILTFVTLIVTQFLSETSFNQHFNALMTRWEECQQHEDSIRRDQRISSQHGQNVNVPPSWMTRVSSKWSAFLSMFSTAVRRPLDRNSGNKNARAAGWEESESPQVTIRWRGANTQFNGPGIRSQNTMSSPNVSSLTTTPHNQKPRTSSHTNVDQTSLARKPLRGYEEGRLSLKSKMMSVLGINPYIRVPPGLKNGGQNLCFMNCILQCLARTPHLLDTLSVEAYEEASCSVAESAFLSALTELLRYCNTSPGSSDITALDSIAFQQASACLPGSPVVSTGYRQVQQDAAEFLMWLLAVVHSVLNKNRKGNRSKTNQSERYNSSTLSMLKFLYGNLDAGRIEELKYACRREIDMANGLDNESYAEPIQRLSDLEWLTYKKDNNSVVDDLFTGQLVEAFHCLTDNHISVHMQTFIVLAVPIVSPREVSGIVHLEDCFTKFCNIEHLTGREGLQCSMCDKGTRSPHSCPSGGKQHNPQRRTVLKDPSEVSVMSPIPNSRLPVNDSAFVDAHFRTSTPIHQRTNGVLSPLSPPPRIRLRDAERRCLLRQLPECLVIQIMRFSMNMQMGDIRKIRMPINIPLKNMNLSHLIFDTVTNREDMTATQNYRYDLYAFCIHIGGESTNYGHYVAYCRNEDGSWFRFDDEHVTEVNINYELTTKEVRENSYLLFYRRHSKVSR